MTYVSTTRVPAATVRAHPSRIAVLQSYTFSIDNSTALCYNYYYFLFTMQRGCCLVRRARKQIRTPEFCLILHHLSSIHCFPAYYMLYCTLTIVLIFNLCVYTSLADIIIVDSAIQVVLISFKHGQTLLHYIHQMTYKR